jgi:hypothetical protein
MFMRVALKMQKLEYGKWKIVPDSNDPLRKFTLNRDIGWATLKLSLYAKEYYHRGNYSDTRWDYEFGIAYGGLFADKNGDILVNSGLKIRPRLARDLIEQINTSVIPNFYNEIENKKKEMVQKLEVTKCLRDNISKLPDLERVRGYSWGGNYYKLPNCPLQIDCQTSSVEVSGNLGYDELVKIANVLGWRKQ